MLINMGAMQVQAGNLFTFVCLFNVFVRVCRGTTHGKVVSQVSPSSMWALRTQPTSSGWVTKTLSC